MPPSPVILVTGASSGIGAATARLFAKKGYRVVLAARRLKQLQAVAKEVNAGGGEAFPIEADVSNLTDIQDMTAAALERFGQIDVLFNNAGFGRLNWLENLDPLKDVEAQIRVNLLGVIWTAQAVLPHMIERRSGHIINMSSVAGLVATPTYSVYAASKFAVRGFTQALRREVSIYGINVSGIFPGGVATEFDLHTGARWRSSFHTPETLRLSADEVAQTVWQLVGKPGRDIVTPWVLKFGVWINELLPGAVDWIVERGFTRRERRV